MCKKLCDQKWSEWCSCKGMENRRQGMYRLEKKSTKNMICGSMCCLTLLYLILGCLHAWRSNNAKNIDGNYDASILGFSIGGDYLEDSYTFQTDSGVQTVAFPQSISGEAYDSCRVPTFSPAEDVNLQDLLDAIADVTDHCGTNLDCYKQGTRWENAFTFNAWMLFLNMLNFITLTFGACWYFPRLFGTYCNWCCGLAHFIAIVTGLGRRFGPQGKLCMFNEAPSNFDDGTRQFKPDERTYADDGRMLAGLMLFQLFLCMFQCFAVPCALFQTPSYDKRDKDEKKEIKKMQNAMENSQMQQMQMMQMQMMQMQMNQNQNPNGQPPMATGQPINFHGVADTSKVQ